MSKKRCVTGNWNDCCGDKRFGCCDISAMRYSPAGPAVLTQEWDIGGRSCAGNLKKCKGFCGNNYCSADGKCPEATMETDISLIAYMREPFEPSGAKKCQAKAPLNYKPSSVGVL